ncbi:class I SAM-dependent methyltransferase [Azohydromonas aeria]|uniref:class I SAM-dependent methyltransferase n=1 Tax=Azohydromonas aeria TaxID=2590212 RepID=UPI0012FB189C|nr:class I SAM-dependent methyltransferase [Azohydromonas aeria]
MSATISFNDGAAYERYMGIWSRSAGNIFLDWLNPAPGLQWLDVGCGNGAFTDLIIRRCRPAMVRGVDPSAEQIEYARAHLASDTVQFEIGDAQALPFADDGFDLAVMPLVIFFVPDPARGVAEMARVGRPGGWVAAYAWDMAGGGFPYAPLQEEMRALGLAVPLPPSPEASRLETLRGLWHGAGLVEVETTVIEVQREFQGFEDYWDTVRGGPSVGARIREVSAAQKAELQARVRARLETRAGGPFTCSARAHAIRGRVAGA